MRDSLKYFKSEKDMYVFILLKTDGRIRCDLLKIKRYHYSSKTAAKKWFDKIHEIIKDNNEAVEVLKEIYNNMTDV